MTDFVAGKYQVLVCTTIIESGLDIPNCNTILIDGADRFGLAQLYQLRGRVGRFKHQAYAYLLLHRHTRLLDVARQRLNALRQHNQLGAGFRIAMRDLELRGAGNLLGAEQSGHIAGVGFELYCQLLRQSVARLKGDRTGRRHPRQRETRLRLCRRGRAGRRPPPVRGRLHGPARRRGAPPANAPRSRRASRSATSAKPACALIFTAASRWSGISPASARSRPSCATGSASSATRSAPSCWSRRYACGRNKSGF